MTPADLKSARRALGLSADGFARVAGVASGRTVRRWESGKQNVPQRVTMFVTALLASQEMRALYGVGGDENRSD